MASVVKDPNYKLKPVAPLRRDPPGSIKEMPKPQLMHHLHILTNENYEKMVEFYQRLFNADIVTETGQPSGQELTFLSYDDYDHRVVLIKLPHLKPKAPGTVGVSHLAFGYASLGEILYIYQRMKEWGYNAPHWVVNHGNSTSMYYTDPDGNQVETLVDNFAPIDCQNYKRYYQFTETFGDMAEGNFDPETMIELYESGVPEDILLDREKVRAMIKEGKLGSSEHNRPFPAPAE